MTDVLLLSTCVQCVHICSQVLFDGFTKKKFADRTVESFAVFKDGITPEWEDPENKRGGEWSIRKGDVAALSMRSIVWHAC